MATPSSSYFDADEELSVSDESIASDSTEEPEEPEGPEGPVGPDEYDGEEEEEDESDDEDKDEEEEEEEEGGDYTGVMTGGAEEDDEPTEKRAKRVKKIPAKTIYKKPDIKDDDDDEDDDDDDDGEMYLQKFDHSVNDNYIVDYHPESVLQNYDEILAMTKVVRNDDGIIIDDLHKTIPYLTKYEKARILGQRAKQINSGASAFVKVPENVIDGYIIAELELREKRIPFIIRRPLPNGGSEYWSLKDLEDISF